MANDQQEIRRKIWCPGCRRKQDCLGSAAWQRVWMARSSRDFCLPRPIEPSCCPAAPTIFQATSDWVSEAEQRSGLTKGWPRLCRTGTAGTEARCVVFC